MMDTKQWQDRLAEVEPITVHGRILQATGLVIEGSGSVGAIGELCDIIREDEGARISAEAVGFRDQRVLLMPLGDMRGIGPSSRLVMHGRMAGAKVGPGLLGRVLDGLGEPLDGLGPISADQEYPLYAAPMNPMLR
ncbi:MAG TPA: flagellum-specific ATP synthase FliI, partial [Nitrospirales bacterium]|nr:flagellum-specific ATP synthase FliI [Nitrospirales bacterium]